MQLQFTDTPEFIAQRFDQILAEVFMADPKSRAVLNAEYEKLVQMAKVHHGEDGPVHLVDPALAQLYSDLYKDEVGCRPRLTCSQQVASDYVKQFEVKP